MPNLIAKERTDDNPTDIVLLIPVNRVLEQGEEMGMSSPKLVRTFDDDPTMRGFRLSTERFPENPFVRIF